MYEEKIPISFRCYFPFGDPCDKIQTMYLCDIHRWIESYLFTHPTCTCISVRVLAKYLDLE